MARSLASKPNVTAPGGDYPYGRIKDNSGINDGTPVNEEVYGDFHQFFARLLNFGGVTANNLPENTANGYQYIDALANYIDERADDVVAPVITRVTALENLTTIVEIGPWDMSSGLTSVNHTIADFKKIRSVNVIVQNDLESTLYKLDLSGFVSGDVEGYVGSISSTTLVLDVKPSGFFDSTDFDSTSINRGWVTIIHVP